MLFLTLLETVFPPIPSELIMPLAGYLVAQERMAMVAVIVAGTAGSVVGALLLYWFGARLGEERLKAFADRHGRWLTLSRQDVERAGAWFGRHGGWAVFVCRLIPGLRSLISIPAGIHRMPMARFIAFTTAGSAAWTALLVYAGFALGPNFERRGLHRPRHQRRPRAGVGAVRLAGPAAQGRAAGLTERRVSRRVVPPQPTAAGGQRRRACRIASSATAPMAAAQPSVLAWRERRTSSARPSMTLMRSAPRSISQWRRSFSL